MISKTVTLYNCGLWMDGSEGMAWYRRYIVVLYAGSEGMTCIVHTSERIRVYEKRSACDSADGRALVLLANACPYSRLRLQRFVHAYPPRLDLLHALVL